MSTKKQPIINYRRSEKVTDPVQTEDIAEKTDPQSTITEEPSLGAPLKEGNSEVDTSEEEE